MEVICIPEVVESGIALCVGKGGGHKGVDARMVNM